MLTLNLLFSGNLGPKQFILMTFLGMFDRDQSGTINFPEFVNLWTYIQQWKGVFDRYDRDRSGAIEVNELQTALNEMGYRVSPSLVQLLITR